jgi:hypothetical protein
MTFNKYKRTSFPITSCSLIIILENILNQCIEKCAYGNFNHRYNVSPIHLHALFGMRICTKVVRVCADRL